MSKAKKLDTFGMLIVEPMCASNMSKDELAQAVGISVRWLEDYAYGRRRPQRKTICKFAAVLGVLPSEIDPARQQQTSQKPSDVDQIPND